MPNNQRATQEPPSCTYGYPAEPYYVVLPPAPVDPWKRRRRLLGYGALLICIALLVVAAFYFLWPSEPRVRVASPQLNYFSYYTVPQPGSFVPRLFLNLSMFMKAEVKNWDYYEVEYDPVKVGIGYRGRSIGSNRSESGRISARRSTDVNATLGLDGVEVVHDVAYLLEDLDKGKLPLDSVTKFEGRIKVWFINIGFKETASCEVVINPSEKTIIRQDCE